MQAPGICYVDDGCIGCMVCVEIAPETFLRAMNEDLVVVGRQPAEIKAIIRCEEARELCPVDAIRRRANDRRPFTG